MDKKKDTPAEVETVTVTMTRPVAEAVKIACEWYLRLHMGQFWDLAEDLCMAKFYSDAKHNEFKTKEQRDNAFTVSIHRRNDMQDGLDNLYRRYALPAPISDLMEIPYRAEQVWLGIRHALAHPTSPVPPTSPARLTSPAQPTYPTQVIRLTYSSGLQLW